MTLEQDFDKLSHPIRTRILLELAKEPLGFAELKGRLGLESSGHLQHHLSKLDDLVTQADGKFTLTDKGRKIVTFLEEYRGSISRLYTYKRMSVIGSYLVLIAGAFSVIAWFFIDVIPALFGRPTYWPWFTEYLAYLPVGLIYIIASMKMNRNATHIVVLSLSLIALINWSPFDPFHSPALILAPFVTPIMALVGDIAYLAWRPAAWMRSNANGST